MASEKMKQLIAKREALNARIRQEQIRAAATERKADTRRKVLAGALALEWAAQDGEFAAMLRAKLNGFLVREADRALFDLPAVQKSDGGNN
jgi:hypothetical protein